MDMECQSRPGSMRKVSKSIRDLEKVDREGMKRGNV